jgi:carbon monoxide dehydrogenase subunit G
MAHYSTTVSSPWTPAEAFAYMADLRNFAEWDPGVRRAELVAGDGPGPDAAYVLAVKGFVGTIDMRYETLQYDPDERVIVRAETSMFVSLDEIVVVATDDGCEVTYDAQLDLRGPLRLADPALGLAFKGIGDRAAKGLRRVLGTARTAS